MTPRIALILFLIVVSVTVWQYTPASSAPGKESPRSMNSLVGEKAPAIAQGDWINSEGLALDDLHGKVVLVEFWALGCYNCRNTIPYLEQWHEKFSKKGLVVMGVHTPEFSRERSIRLLREETEKLGITYPVVTDNDEKTWMAYSQEYWPTRYLIDKQGIVREVHIGEGNYAETEKKIEVLLQ